MTTFSMPHSDSNTQPSARPTVVVLGPLPDVVRSDQPWTHQHLPAEVVGIVHQVLVPSGLMPQAPPCCWVMH